MLCRKTLIQLLYPFPSENLYNPCVILVNYDIILLYDTLRTSTSDLIITINLTPFDVEVEHTALSISAWN